MSLVDALWLKVDSNLSDFSAWVNLLDAAERQPCIDVTRKAFDAFLANFPYCYGYWKKYANAERQFGNGTRCLQIFERGVDAVPLSVDLWAAYLDANSEITHGLEDYKVHMRNLFELALEKAGLEFRSDPLWMKYINWESSQNNWERVLSIYDRLLCTPTQLYYQNWDSFKKMIQENRPEDFLPLDEFAELLARVSPVAGTTMRIALSSSNMAPVPIPNITDIDRNAIRKLVVDRREIVYQATYLLIMKRWYFEEKIRRPYFHVKPLDEAQLSNWAEYLSFEESEAAGTEAALAVPAKIELFSQITYADVQLAKKRVRVLYERCLVACALYESMWIRYARYLELVELDVRGAREVWRRACGVHLRAKPTIHWHWALFEVRHPVESNSKDNGIEEPLPISPLQIFTQLEKRLTDCAIVCSRRADIMRREGKQLLDVIVCLRSGISRLRARSIDQTNLAHTVTGPNASFSAAMALATAAQARAGASYLASKLARLLHFNVGNRVPPEGIPIWQLLLSTSYKPDPNTPKGTSELNLAVNSDRVTEIEPEVEDAVPILTTAFIDVKEEQQKQNESGEMEVEDMEPPEVTPESLIVESVKTNNDDTDVGSDSPPVVIGRKKNSPFGVVAKSVVSDKMAVEEVKVSAPEAALKNSNGFGGGGDEVCELPIKRRRCFRWGDVDENTDFNLANLRTAEAERLTHTDCEHAGIVDICPPSDPSALPEEMRRFVSSEDAALAVLRDAIDFDPRNERLYAQMLDIAYQRQPIDVDGFVEFANLAIVDSILPATIKLAFAQRKLQFLEEFSNNINKISAAFDEYVQLAQLVVQCTGAGTGDATEDSKKYRQGGIDAPQAYTTPDLLNVMLPTPLRPSVRGNTVSNGPVHLMPCLDAGSANLVDTAATEAGEMWRGLEPMAYAAAMTSSYANGGGNFFAPMVAGADCTADMQAPPPVLLTGEIV